MRSRTDLPHVHDLAIYEAIKEFQKTNGFPPSYRDIAVLVGVRSISTVAAHMQCLKEHGFIDWDPKRKRTLRVVR